MLIIGAGALGAANAEAIVRAGVGKITIADRDYVEGVIYKGNNYIQKKTQRSINRSSSRQSVIE